MKFKGIKVSLSLPIIGGIEGSWEPDDTERQAAWEMYVELVTRISVVEMKPGEGLLREALSSLYTLFDTTREILKKYGPTVAQPKVEENLSFGILAVTVLNTLIRPVLAKWHPILLDYENDRESSVSQMEHESNWEKSDELREELNSIRKKLIEYANILGEVAGVHSLIIQTN